MKLWHRKRELVLKNKNDIEEFLGTPAVGVVANGGWLHGGFHVLYMVYIKLGGRREFNSPFHFSKEK